MINLIKSTTVSGHGQSIKMKITRQQLRKLISETSREFKVKTVSPDQYAADIATLPAPMRSIADGPRDTETPRKSHVVGNFFMTKGVPYKPPRGYGTLNKLFNFYMILPSGESISIDTPEFQPGSVADAMQYLNLLNQNVTPALLNSLESAENMIDQIRRVISMMETK